METLVFALEEAAARISAKCPESAADKPKAVRASATISEVVARSSPDAAAMFMMPSIPFSIREVLYTTGITATAGIGTNLYLTKLAMDITAKHAAPDKNGVRIAELDEESFRYLLWDHKPLTDFWMTGPGTVKRLEKHGMDYYFCDSCRYCFSAEKLPDRCPDCGAVAHDNKKAVRPASKTEIEELLKIQKEDKEDTQNEST